MSRIVIQLFPKGVHLLKSFKSEFSNINLFKHFLGFWGFGALRKKEKKWGGVVSGGGGVEEQTAEMHSKK